MIRVQARDINSLPHEQRLEFSSSDVYGKKKKKEGGKTSSVSGSDASLPPGPDQFRLIVNECNLPPIPHTCDLRVSHLLLKLENPVHESFRGRRTYNSQELVTFIFF